MKETIEHSQTERELVLAIVRVLPHAEGARVTQEDGEVIAVELPDQKGAMLRLAVFSKAAVGDLLDDESREVKIEYLQRDIRRAARSRREFRYPRQFQTTSARAKRRSARDGEKNAQRPLTTACSV